MRCKFFVFILLTCPLFSEEIEDKLKEEIVTTQHKTSIRGKAISYRADSGNLILKDEKGEDLASIFFIAYTVEGKQRPVTFCFNGGPGSSSVWLHLKAFGPKSVEFNELEYIVPPYHYRENPESLLDETDLVFIDPVSTGYSKPAPGVDAKKFYGVTEDVNSIANFIRLYITRYNRWSSAKFLAGESYGTTRAAALAEVLHDKHYIDLNGVILISTILNFQTLNDPSRGNDLPYVLYLPTYSFIAGYHGLLKDEPSSKEVEQFAAGAYHSALFEGDRLDPEKKREIAETLSRYTGLTASYILDSNLRVSVPRFTRQLLRDQGKTIGRMDARVTGVPTEMVGENLEFDPSLEMLFGPFTAALNSYLRNELQVKKDEEYGILVNVRPWDYGKEKNQFLNTASNLADAMSVNPHLKVFVASGLADLATPYWAAEYTLTHLGLPWDTSKNISFHIYEGGHMMYFNTATREQVNRDIRKFIQSAQTLPSAS